jgi:hypothetical protein
MQIILTAKPLPSIAADPRLAELESEIARLAAEQNKVSAALSRAERDRAEKRALASATVISRFVGLNVTRSRAAARAAAAAADEECVALGDRLRDIEADHADAIACRVTARDEIARPVATQLRAIIAERVKALDVALTPVLDAMAALADAAEHADRQFTNPADGRYTGVRSGLPVDLIGLAYGFTAALGFAEFTERVAAWRKDVREVMSSR